MEVSKETKEISKQTSKANDTKKLTCLFFWKKKSISLFTQLTRIKKLKGQECKQNCKSISCDYTHFEFYYVYWDCFKICMKDQKQWINYPK